MSDKIDGLPVVPTTGEGEGAFDLSVEGGAPEQLGFDLRFEAGKALLALEDVEFTEAIRVKRALFEVPDVAFPLDVTGGSARFQDKRLTLRAVEIEMRHDALIDESVLLRAGLTLLRERTRSGGVEMLVSLEGPSGPVPVRARGILVAAGESGVALVLHEVITFGPAPRARLDVAESISNAFAIPGGHPARGMVRRADPFRAVFSRLLPAYGWKIPALGDVRIHEAVIAKGTTTLRAWAGDRPEGWKKPRKPRKGPLNDAVALAVFADSLPREADAQLAVIDRAVDEGALPAAVVPYAADVYRAHARRRAEGDDLVKAAVAKYPEHLGVLSAHVDEAHLTGAERVERLQVLAKQADQADEPWVSSHAYEVAAAIAEAEGDTAAAFSCAESAWRADPTNGHIGLLLVGLAERTGDAARAVEIGRATLDRLEGEAGDVLAIRLAELALPLEGPDEARKLLRRALRKEDRREALLALARVELADGAVERASEVAARLLVVEEGRDGADVQLLAAEIAIARNDDDAARMHLSKARDARPDDPKIALRLAELSVKRGDLSRAIDVLEPIANQEPVSLEVVRSLAKHLAQRRQDGDADRALQLLARVPEELRGDADARLEAEARSILGEVGPLAAILEADGVGGGDAEALGRAAELYLQADQVADAGRVLAASLQVRGDAGALAETVAGLSAEVAPVAVAALVAALDADAQTGERRVALADALAARGQGTHAHALLAFADDRVLVEKRAGYASEAERVALEIADRQALLALSDDAQAAEVWLRLAELHTREDGGGVAEASAAYAAAAALGEVRLGPWLQAALKAGEATVLAELLRRADAPLDEIEPSALQAVVHGDDALSAAEDVEVRLRVLRSLSARTSDERDLDAYLALLKAVRSPAEAAPVLAELGVARNRPRWLLAAVELDDQRGDPDAGYERLRGALGTSLESDRATVRALFARAAERGDADILDRAGRVLLSRDDLDDTGRLEVLRTRATKLRGGDEEIWLAALADLLDAEPGADDALIPFVQRAVTDGERAPALERLTARARHGLPLPAPVRELLSSLAAQAESHQDEVIEIGSRALLAEALEAETDLPAHNDALRTQLQRLTLLHEGLDELPEAAAALERLLAVTGDNVEGLKRLASIQRRLERDEALAHVVSRWLELAPDDLEGSDARVALLERTGRWEALVDEYERRVLHIVDPPERTAVLLTVGDILNERLGRPAEAERWWLQATRVSASEAPLSRLFQHADDEGRARLRTRAHVAAAHALVGNPAGAVHAEEAGALLAGILDHPRLAIALYQRAAASADAPLTSYRALAELHRSLGDQAAALEAVAAIIELTDGVRRAEALEARADLLATGGDPAAAAEARVEALAIAPEQTVTARALERYLLDEDDIVGALGVRRAHADASEDGAQRAQTYALLAERADDAGEVELAVELGRAALEQNGSLAQARLLLTTNLEKLNRYEEATEELGLLVGGSSLDDGTRASLARRKARIEREQLAEPARARRTLRQHLLQDETNDAVMRDLAEIEEGLGETASAAQLLEEALKAHPEGTDVLGPRRGVLEWIARLLEDARAPREALQRLQEAAALGKLSRQGELARARLAEQLGDDDVAAAALRTLLTSTDLGAEDRVAFLGRLALACERGGFPDEAFDAWVERAERLPNDEAALLAIERIGRDMDRFEGAAGATQALIRLEAGGPEAIRARWLWLGQDASERGGDAATALHYFDEARALGDDAELRKAIWSIAEAAGDQARALSMLDEIEAAGDSLPPEALLRRAELRLGEGGAMSAILDDVEAALTDDPSSDPSALLSQLDADALAERFMGTPSQPLQDRLLEAVGDPERLSPELIVAIADVRVDDLVWTRAAAGVQSSTDLDSALQRMLLFAARASDDGRGDEASAAHHDAARLLAAGGPELSTWLAHFDALKDDFAADATLAADALRALRDGEAFEQVAELLELSIACELDVDRRRSLRLELVAVCRTALDEPARAIPHLEAEVERDPADRASWGELLECLEEVGHQPALTAALERRIEHAEGIERRELRRRAAELRFDADELEEALGHVELARAEDPGDPELKALARAVHTARGEAALATFLATEIERAEAAGEGFDADDARALLMLEAASVDERAEAALALGAVAPDEVAATLLRGPNASAGEIAAAARWAAESEVGLATLAARAASLADSAALELFDALLARELPLTTTTFGASVVARRYRSVGPAAALVDAERWLAETDGAEARAAVIRLAARIGDRPKVRQHASDALVARLDAETEVLRDGADDAGARAVLLAAEERAATVALIRHGDPAGLARARMEPDPGPVAIHLHAMRATTARLDARAALAAFLLPELRAAAQTLTAQAAFDDGRFSLAREAAADAIAHDAHGEEAWRLRADAAVRLDDDDAGIWCGAAADRIAHVEMSIDYRRRALHLLLRAGDTSGVLEQNLVALCDADADDPALVSEALSIARATQKHGLIDRLLAERVARAKEPDALRAAIEERAEHQLKVTHDPAGAMRTLLQGRELDAEFAERAYQLGTRAGLVVELLDVVDDALASAALSALLGDLEAARDGAAALEGAAARWLEADIAALAGVPADEIAALERLTAEAQPDVLDRLAAACAKAGDGDRAVSLFTNALVAFGPSESRIAGLIAIMPSAEEAAVREALGGLKKTFGGGDEREAPAALLEVWVAAADRLGEREAAVTGRLQLARQLQTDGAWGAWLAVALGAVPDEEIDEALTDLLARPAAFGQALQGAPDALEAALSRQLDSGRTDEVAHVLERLSNRDAPALPRLKARAARELGRPIEAARALLATDADDDEALRGRQQLAARWALEGDDAGLALDALLDLPMKLYDGETRAVATDVAARTPALGAQLWVRLAESPVAENDDADRALEAAATVEDDQLAAAVGAWRLRAASRDQRGWRLARRASAKAERFFGRAIALEVGEEIPVGDAEGEKLKALRDRVVAMRAPVTVDSPLWRARHLRGEAQQSAWRELGDQATEERLHFDAARLFARGGISLASAPIEVRLVADPAISTPVGRATALADAVREDIEASRIPPLLDAIRELDARGYCGARHRDTLAANDEYPVAARLTDRVDRGEGLKLSAVPRGRTLARGTRSTLAALAYNDGQHVLARCLDARVTLHGGTGLGQSDLAARAEDAAADGRALEAIGLLRTRVGLKGVTPGAETQIRAWAESLGRWDLYAESLGREALVVDEVERRCELLLERAEISMSRLNRIDDAALCARRAAQARDDDAAGALWLRAAERAGDDEDLVAALAHREKQVDDESRVELVLRRARLLRERGLAGAALAAVDAAVQQIGEAPALMVERARTLDALGQRQQAAPAYVKAAGVQRDDAIRHEMRRRAATLYLEGGDPDRAVAALLRSAEEGQLEALVEAERVARAEAQPALLEPVLAVLLVTSEDRDQRRAFALERARLLADQLNDRAGAIKQLEQQAVDDDGDVAARFALAEWYLADRRILDAALAYESAVRIPDLPAAAKGPAAREAAGLLSVVGDLDRAGPLADLAIECGTIDPKVLAVARAHHLARGDHARVDDLLELQLDFADGPREAAHVWMERARLRQQHTGDKMAARQALHRVLELRPDHEEALVAMRADADEHASWGSLRAALSRAVDYTNDKEQRVRWLVDIASLDLDRFEDLRAAEATINRALELQPGDPDLLIQKARIQVEAGQLTGLPALLAQAEKAGATAVPGPLQLVRGDALLIGGDRDGATRAFESAAEDPESADRAFDRLLDLARDSDDPHRVLSYLVSARAATSDSVRGMSLARREAELRVSVGDDDGALAALRLILDAEPGDNHGIAALRPLLIKRRRFEELGDRLDRWAQAADAPPERARRTAEVGVFFLDEAADEVRGRRILETALALSPDQPMALLRLAQTAYAARDAQAALPLLSRINASDWPDGEVALLFARADCAVTLDADNAEELLRAVLHVDGDHLRALEALADRATRRGDVDTAEFALERVANVLRAQGNTKSAGRSLHTLAKLRNDRGRYDEALVSALAALELDPASFALLELVAELHERSQNFADAALVWGRMASFSDGADRGRFTLKQGEALLSAARPADAASLLLSLYEQTRQEEHKERALAIAREHGLKEVYARVGLDLDQVVDSEEKARVRSLLQSDPAAALEELKTKAFAAPDDLTLSDQAIEAAERANQPGAIADLLEPRIDRLEGEDRMKIALRAGKAAERAGDLERAAGFVFRAHQVDAENIEVRLELTRVYGLIPQLVDAAGTGVLQLLRRAPSDPRVYEVAAGVAEHQGDPARGRAMRFAQEMLSGAVDVTAAIGRDEVSLASPRAITAGERSALAPSALGTAFPQLVTTLAPALEAAFLDNTQFMATASRIDASSPASAWGTLATSLISGRELKIIVGQTPVVLFHPGAKVTHVILPEDALSRGPTYGAAFVARAVALVRSGGVLAESLPPAEDASLLHVLESALVDIEPLGDEHARRRDTINEVTSPGDLAAARRIAPSAIEVDGGPDLNAWRSACVRFADRFALLVSGSLPAALVVGPAPELLTDPKAALESIQRSSRALDLCAFAARDVVWKLRKSLGFTD